MRPRAIAPLLAALSALAACAPPDFPEDRVFGTGSAQPIPALEPVEPVLADAAQDDGRVSGAADTLQDRGARLRARADALRVAGS